MTDINDVVSPEDAFESLTEYIVHEKLIQSFDQRFLNITKVENVLIAIVSLLHFSSLTN